MAKTRSARAETWQRWYKTARWRRMREQQLRKYPLCQCPHCQERGLPADTVDHVEPHRGDRKLFWSASNLQSMARTCHDRHKQSAERGGQGFMRGVDVKGWPLSKEHEWWS